MPARTNCVHIGTACEGIAQRHCATFRSGLSRKVATVLEYGRSANGSRVRRPANDNHEAASRVQGDSIQPAADVGGISRLYVHVKNRFYSMLVIIFIG